MTDPDDIPAFSYHARRGQPVVDPATRRMALAAGGVSVLVILVALVWGGMKPGMVFGPPPVISALPGPLRMVPADPGGLTVPEANEQIMSGDVSAAAPQLAPAVPDADITQLDQAAGMPSAAAAPQAAQAVAAPPVPPPSVTVPAVPTGPVDIQLAATSDEAGAKQVWAQLQAKMPAIFQDRNPAFVPAVVDGRNLWRLRLGGFGSVAAAQEFCASVIAKGAACTVAAF